MFPIRDTIRSRSFPIVNLLIIAANALVFFFELSLPQPVLEQLIGRFGLVSTRLNLANPLTLLPLFTHMFLHAGWVHFIGNMWTLVIFGDNVEDRIGSMRYLVFYLLGGLAAGILQAVLSPGSTVPAIGASGAIAAVLGAYFVYFPRARVITFIPIFILPWFMEIPALVYLGFWFLTQFFSGALSLLPSGVAAGGGVAWWAHVGGFLFGLLMAAPFRIGRRSGRTYTDDYYPF